MKKLHSKIHFNMKVEEETERITSKIRMLENQAIESQKEKHKMLKYIHKTL